MTEVILHSIEAMESNQWSWVGGDNPDYRGYRGGDAGEAFFRGHGRFTCRVTRMPRT